MKLNDITWLIGGPQGSGIETAANIFSHACAEFGYHIFGKREYYSNIKGKHSYYELRLSNKKICSNVHYITILIGIDAETIFRHIHNVIDYGIIIYDKDLLDIKLDDIPTIENITKNRIRKHLLLQHKPLTIRGILDTTINKHIFLYAISFSNIINASLKSNIIKKFNLSRMNNMIGISLSAAYLKIPLKILLKSINGILKSSIINTNKQISSHAYHYGLSKIKNKNNQLKLKITNKILIHGYQSIAMGKILAGCKFQSYYPITPATDECEYLEQINFNYYQNSIMIIQSEDELSAICMIIGSALTGTRSSTSTSGPGFSLMVESLGWAGINEVPIVITLYQRSGPSTGLPTRTGQEDLLFAINAGHGEFPKIVYSSGDIEECFYDTIRCFNFAEIYQLPVIHILDKFLASSTITCNRFDLNKIKITRGKLIDTHYDDDDYKRFKITKNGISPRAKLGDDKCIFWNTGDESDEYGHITEDPIYRIAMMEKRLSRLNYILKTLPTSEQAITHSLNEYCIISWGSTKGPILDALDMLKKENIRIGFIQIKLLHPFPTSYIKSLLTNIKIIIDIEANHTCQLGKLFQENLCIPINYFIVKYNGRPMTCNEIYDSLKKIIKNNANQKEVLIDGN